MCTYSPALFNTQGVILVKTTLLSKYYSLALTFGQYEFKICNETSFLYESKSKD